MNTVGLCSISPIDGRYRSYTSSLNHLFSEYAFIKQRVIIEIKYFIFLLKLDTVEFPYNKDLDDYMNLLCLDINDEYICAIKKIEKKIHHDVKSIEYFLTEQLCDGGFDKYINLLHFGLTSQDTNTMAYSISLLTFNKEIFFPLFDKLLSSIQLRVVEWSKIVILGRTHGQAATWTLLGKEFTVFRSKLVMEYDALVRYKFTTKIGGAVGNMTSHKILGKKDWDSLLTWFANQFGLRRTKDTTQIHNYNEYAHYFDMLKRVCSTLIDMCRDIWLYCSLGELKLKKPKEYVGSSIMPHKVNPIEFENAEGNLKIAEMWFEFLSRELLKSRLQRDLTDSTILRNMGTVLGHLLVSFENINRGFTFLKPDIKKIENNLLENTSSMSEVDQHLLRLKNTVVGYDARRDKDSTPQTKDKVEYYKQFILDSSD